MYTREELIGRQAAYLGKNRRYLSEGTYEIVDAREDGTAVAFEVTAPDGYPAVEWVGIKSVALTPVKPKPEDVDALFTAASGGHREILVNEIARIKTRLTELESALTVIDSL